MAPALLFLYIPHPPSPEPNTKTGAPPSFPARARQPFTLPDLRESYLSTPAFKHPAFASLSIFKALWITRATLQNAWKYKNHEAWIPESIAFRNTI